MNRSLSGPMNLQMAHALRILENLRSVYCTPRAEFCGRFHIFCVARSPFLPYVFYSLDAGTRLEAQSMRIQDLLEELGTTGVGRE